MLSIFALETNVFPPPQGEPLDGDEGVVAQSLAVARRNLAPLDLMLVRTPTETR